MENFEQFLLSQGLSFRRSGDNLVMCCPFHDDRKPSFSVSIHHPHLYLCFSCGARGNIFSLYHHLTGLPYHEESSEHAGWGWGRTFRKTEQKKEFRPLAEFSDISGEIVSLDSDPEAMSYFYRRGISIDIPISLGVKVVRRGLCGRMPLRNRLLIPLGNNSYEFRDYTGRQSPKVLYPKGSNLSFLYRQGDLDRSSPLVLVEGLMDVMAVFPVTSNVTTVFGTHVRDAQVNSLSDFSQVIVFPDNDAAGWKMLNELSSTLLYNGVDTRIALPPREGSDPGDLSTEEIKYCLLNAVPASVFFCRFFTG